MSPSAYTNPVQQNKSNAAANNLPVQQGNADPAPKSELQQMVNASPQVKQLRAYQAMANGAVSANRHAALPGKNGSDAGIVQRLSVVIQKATDADDGTEKLLEIITSLKAITGTATTEKEKAAVQKMAVYISDLETIAASDDTALKHTALKGLYEEAGKQLNTKPTEVAAKMPAPAVAQRVLGAGAITAIVLVSVGGAALLGYGIYRLVKYIAANRAQQYGQVQDEDEVDLEEAQKQQPRPGSVTVMQGQSAIAQQGARVQNAGTTACGLILGFGTTGIAVYHWPFMSRRSDYLATFQGVVDQVGQLNNIIIVTNNFPSNDNGSVRNNNIGTVGYIRDAFGVNTVYYVHTEQDNDVDPLGTVTANNFQSVHAVTAVNLD